MGGGRRSIVRVLQIARCFAAANVVDGNATTRWSSSYADAQWRQVDLGARYNISYFAAGANINIGANASDADPGLAKNKAVLGAIDAVVQVRK